MRKKKYSVKYNIYVYVTSSTVSGMQMRYSFVRTISINNKGIFFYN